MPGPARSKAPGLGSGFPQATLLALGACQALRLGRVPVAGKKCVSDWELGSSAWAGLCGFCKLLRGAVTHLSWAGSYTWEDSASHRGG